MKGQEAKNSSDGSVGCLAAAETAVGQSGLDAQVKFRDLVLEESRKGNVVFMGIDGPMVAPLDEFIKQPAEGILYDLNRSPEVVMSLIDDPKWVNDYAVSMVIRRLREQCSELKS